MPADPGSRGRFSRASNTVMLPFGSTTLGISLMFEVSWVWDKPWLRFLVMLVSRFWSAASEGSMVLKESISQCSVCLDYLDPLGRSATRGVAEAKLVLTTSIMSWKDFMTSISYEGSMDGHHGPLHHHGGLQLSPKVHRFVELQLPFWSI